MIFYNIALSNPKLKSAKMHKHTTWEIILNLSGTGINYIEEKETEFYPGFITICPPDTYHGKSANDGFFQDIFISFTDSHIFKNLNNFDFVDDSEHTIENLMYITHRIFQNKEKGHVIIVNSLLEAICNILTSWDKSSKTRVCVEILKNEIIKNFTDIDFKIEHAIKQTNYCPDYVRRCFKKEIGLTPNEYLNVIRIEHAKKLLLQDASPSYFINDVAYLSGFSDAGYFTRVFKKHEGISPSKLKHNTENKIDSCC
jgi:AraC family L-rhamnose operon regulatory protein RhaS